MHFYFCKIESPKVQFAEESILVMISQFQKHVTHQT